MKQVYNCVRVKPDSNLGHLGAGTKHGPSQSHSSCPWSGSLPSGPVVLQGHPRAPIIKVISFVDLIS